jgi:hypothetical protein
MFQYCRYRDLHDAGTSAHMHYVCRLLKQHGGLRLFEAFDLPPVVEPLHVRLLAHLLRLCNHLGILRRYCDDRYPSSRLIDDYSQDLRYTHFANVYFRFRADVMDAGDHYARAIQQATYPVAIHVRRGDHLYPENLRRFGICDADYYRRAMELILRRHPEASFFVFSDDLPWARLHLTSEHIFFVNHTDAAPSDAVEMYLMTLCRGHIISNSTFGYWGAYLAPRAKAFNIYPKQWFRETTWGTPPIFPPGWIAL